MGENALFALPQVAVVARVARSIDMVDTVAKELAVADWLTKRGFPAVHPTTHTPQPIEAYGRLVTFWEYIPDSTPATSYAVLATLLRDFHALPDPPFPVPSLNPFPKMMRRLKEACGIRNEDLRFLSESCARVEKEFQKIVSSTPSHLVHGDAHLGNVLSTQRQSLLIDYEATAIGLRAWDLIPIALAVDRFGLPPAEYANFVDTYGSDVTALPSYPILRNTRELGMTTWLLQMAQSGQAADEFALRMTSLRTNDLEQRWNRF
ncbi:phosphotransferase enzyme family protein [Streptomyces sp. NPDC048508]|uniref:phosphotransferase enzyme family protein n=1 Tax=Streptomyces sp. NPDC048508 TaxID=3365561 RepID=UPI00370FA221